MANVPAISVVIPLFNAEKYFAECLKSVLDQIFKDYEIIVVNDGSTDGSRKIAESYLEKFGGRLKIFDNEKNFGVSAARNKGLQISRGEYIFFLDADDLILPDALENMYGLAKNFDVDVVNCTGHFDLGDDGKEKILKRLKKPTATDENIFEADVEWRAKNLLADNFYWALWRKFLRRDFLVRNGLFFPDKVDIYEDRIWTVGVLLCAEKILHTPLTAYVYRKSADSLTRKKRTPLQNINAIINAVFQGIGWLDAAMNKVSFIETKPNYRYAILMHVAKTYFTMIYKSSIKISQGDMYQSVEGEFGENAGGYDTLIPAKAEIYSSIKDQFGKNFGEYDVLIPVICTLINSYEKTLLDNKSRIAKLEKNLK